MTKFALVLIIAAFAVATEGYPTRGDDIASAALNSDWDRVHNLLSTMIRQKYNLSPLTSGDVRSLKPQPGGHVYGESEYTFHTSSNVNGKTSSQSGGHKIINEDGKVVEYDFKP